MWGFKGYYCSDQFDGSVELIADVVARYGWSQWGGS